MLWNINQTKAIIMLLLLIGGLWAAPVGAEETAVDSTVVLPDLEPFLAATIGAQLRELGVPGAAVAVVADGQLLFAQGYGLANQAENQPVDGQRTLFRTGSVGKLITWTAVMQLVEQGRLDLHADVNGYLDFAIPATFAEPITLAHLMTHTAGFEDQGEALFVLDEAKMMPLRQYLVELQPDRVFPPGRAQAYSNYGTALAGYIVERVAGEPFTDYVDKHIFAPLEMSHSTLRQPLPAELAPHLAVGYGPGDLGALPGGFLYAPPYPAGAMSASAADMGRFMLAHLQDGRYGDAIILQPETAALMHSRQYAPDPRLDGMGYGIMRQQANGRDVLFHRGSAFQFNAGLYLLPAENVGLYIVYNGAGGIDAPADLWQQFMDRYYPATETAVMQPAPGDAQEIAAYNGEYHLARAHFSGPAKIFRLLESAQVTASGDGYLQLTVEGRTERYAPVEPGLFRHETDGSYLAFHTDDEGGRWLSLDGRPAFLNFTATSAFAVPWYASLSVSVLLIGLTVLLFAGSAMGWLIGWLRHRRAEQLSLRLSRWTAVAFLLSLLFFLIAFAGVVGSIDPAFGVPRLFFGEAAGLELVLALPWLAAGAAVGLFVSAVFVWRETAVALWGKLHLTLLSLMAVAIIWWLAYWSLLGL
jgi:CubicO group peptidase (beta-lactamase class C family)